MAGLLGDTEVSPLTLGLLQAGSALMSGGRQGLAQAPMAFAGGLLQGQEMQRARQAQALREQMLREQMAMQQREFGMREREYEAKNADRMRKDEFLATLPPELRQAAMLDPSVAAKMMLPQKPEQPFAKVDPKDFTEESFGAFVRSASAGQPDYSLLKPRRRVSVSDGVAYDPEATQPGTVFNNPQRVANDLMIAGPGGAQVNAPLMNARSQIAAAGATRVNTPVQLIQEREESKTVGKFFGDMYADLQKAGMQAQSKINNLNRLSQLMEGTSTGKLTPAAATVAAYADSLGIKIDPKLGDKQALESLSNELALQARSPSGGAGMPGAMSDADRVFLQNIVPNLSKTPEGNRQIVETMRKLAQRDRDVARLATEYRRRTGGLDDGFATALQQFADANPMFPAAAPAAPSSGREKSGRINQPSVDDLVRKYGGNTR